VRAFLPDKTEPSQIIQHRADEFRLRACRVEVFIAQHENAALFTGALLREPKGPRVTKVQVTRRGRRDTSAVIHFVSAFGFSRSQSLNAGSGKESNRCTLPTSSEQSGERRMLV